MNGWDKFSFILELGYYIAGIGMFATVIIGLYQLKAVKDDIRTKNQRASIEKSLEYLNWFACDFLPQLVNYVKGAKEIKEMIIQKTPEGKTRERIKQELTKKQRIEISVDDSFMKDDNYFEEKRLSIACELTSKADHILNQLEYFAAAMTSGLADEKLAFNPLSESYCDTVEDLYDVLCFMRKENSNLYSHTINLYKIWKPKINKEKLEKEQRAIAEKISTLQHNEIKSIGI